MILVDTSIWVDHLRKSDAALAAALTANTVATHPFVIGELACGHMMARDQILTLLRSLPKVPTATDDEVLQFLERRRLYGRGLGYIDAHLLAAASLPRSGRLWTRDKRLKAAAKELHVSYSE